ncbi:uncharacterized protein LOC110461164 isoform X2 [Mizuhopecten yessoensis]|uniref:uncharacterized protein LOC110461164 isoform X2 n=1 Tax=Mizuhopecten yessoensis TaxID=6573 RepID=UPI000B458068|nr:uncharacterized protein LOC110461164 isoform X2 [Mizuhopecten yessoensis]
MAEGGDPKDRVEGMEDDEYVEDRKKTQDFWDTVRKVMQQQQALQVYDDQGPIVTLPQLVKKWSSHIDDTIDGVGEAFPSRDSPQEEICSPPPPSEMSPEDFHPPPYSKSRPPPPLYHELDKPKLPSEFGHTYGKSPKRKYLYTDPETPEVEVELTEMPPRRTQYMETSISAGPTRESYRRPSLDAAVNLSRIPGRASPEVFADTEIDDLPPGVEDKNPPPPTQLATVRRDEAARDVESARTRESETYECTSCGRFNHVATRVGRFFLRQKEHSTGRFLLLVGAIVAFLGIVVFLGVFPNSFVYVEHYEIALLKNTFTGAVDRSVTYYPGCYVLGPEREFVKFPGSAVFVSLTEAVFTKDKLEITITFHFQYFIRPSELGELHRKFGTDYKEVIESVIRSRVKNSAIYLSVDEFRFNRTYIEKKFFDIVKSRLQGTCCPDCCPSCTNATVCSVCDTSSMCDPIYHVDVRYFQLSAVVIDPQVSERYLQSLLLKVNAEKEFFRQNHTVLVKQTEQQVEQIKNKANEMVRAGEAEGAATLVVAEANREANITTSYVAALWTMYTRLGITDMDHKLSLMMVRALEDVNVKGNLYRGYRYANQTQTFVTPSG